MNTPSTPIADPHHQSHCDPTSYPLPPSPTVPSINPQDVVRVFTSPIRIHLTVPLSVAARDPVRAHLLTRINGRVGSIAHSVVPAKNGKIPAMVFRLKPEMTLQRRMEIKEEFIEHVRKAEEKYLQDDFGEFVFKKSRWVAVGNNTAGEEVAVPAVENGKHGETTAEKPKLDKVAHNKPPTSTAETKPLEPGEDISSVSDVSNKQPTKLNAAAPEFKPPAFVYQKPTVVDEDAETPLVTEGMDHLSHTKAAVATDVNGAQGPVPGAAPPKADSFPKTTTYVARLKIPLPPNVRLAVRTQLRALQNDPTLPLPRRNIPDTEVTGKWKGSKNRTAVWFKTYVNGRVTPYRQQELQNAYKSLVGQAEEKFISEQVVTVKLRGAKWIPIDAPSPTGSKVSIDKRTAGRLVHDLGTEIHKLKREAALLVPAVIGLQDDQAQLQYELAQLQVRGGRLPVNPEDPDQKEPVRREKYLPKYKGCENDLAEWSKQGLDPTAHTPVSYVGWSQDALMAEWQKKRVVLDKLYNRNAEIPRRQLELKKEMQVPREALKFAKETTAKTTDKKEKKEVVQE